MRLSNIKFSVGYDMPHYWWEVLQLGTNGWIALKVHDNPAYIDSMGEQSATVSGCIGGDDRPPKRGDCLAPVTANPATVQPNTFARYMLELS